MKRKKREAHSTHPSVRLHNQKKMMGGGEALWGPAHWADSSGGAALLDIRKVTRNLRTLHILIRTSTRHGTEGCLTFPSFSITLMHPHLTLLTMPDGVLVLQLPKITHAPVHSPSKFTDHCDRFLLQQ